MTTIQPPAQWKYLPCRCVEIEATMTLCLRTRTGRGVPL